MVIDCGFTGFGITLSTSQHSANLKWTQRFCGIALSMTVFTVCGAAQSKPSKQTMKEKDGMVWIPDGTFWMGSDDPAIDDAKPVHQVHLKGFWIDKTEVTNEAFAKFVKATGYRTVAERKPETKSIRPIPPDQLVPLCFFRHYLLVLLGFKSSSVRI